MFRKKLLFALCITALFTKVHSQLSGAYNVPGSFTSLASAINSLNIGGVTGPVTINIQAGYTETAVAGGYSLYAVVGTSSVNTISFKKSGAGANPRILAYTGGVRTASSSVHDGVWRLIGADHMIIDGIDITDNNNSEPATMEFGFGFFKASTGDGCQNNTITNCVVTLKRGNNAPGAFNDLPGSCGIEMVNATPSAHTTQLFPVSASGSNSNNRFYSNLVQNCNIGFGFNRVISGSATAFADYNNDIGGTSAVTGNTVVNYGGGNNTSTKASAIYTRGQYNINISYNQINNNNGSGVSCLSPLYGIWSDAAPSANVSITNNTVSLKAGNTCYSGLAIYNDAGSEGQTNTVSISNNLITNCTNTLSSYTAFYGVINNASARHVLISGNTFTNNSVALFNAGAALIANTGLVTGSLSVQNNLLSHKYTFSGPNHTVSMIQVASSASANVSCNSNTFTGMSLTGTVAVAYVKVMSANNKLFLNNNLWQNITTAFNGPVILMSNASMSDSVFTMNNNTVSNYINTGASNGFTCYAGSNNTYANCVSTYSGNVFSGITSTAAPTVYSKFYGILTAEGSSPNYTRKLIFNNSISNVAYSCDGVYGIYANNLGDGTFNLPSEVQNNTVTAISGRFDVYGISTGTATAFNNPPLVHSNTINAISSTGASGGRTYGASVASGDGGIRFYKNKITNISNPGGGAAGIEIYSGTDKRIFNNLIGAITATSTNQDAAVGIYLPYNESDAKIYNNSIYLSGQSYGSSCIYNVAGQAEIRNNILINNSTPTGTALATAICHPNNFPTSVYSNLSDNNLFYAGTPGPNNALAVVGTVTYTSISQMKASLGGRELNSVSENVAFNSTFTPSSNFLTIDPSIATAVESGAVAVPWIIEDYAGAARSGSLTDIGAYEGNYTLPATDQQAPVVLSYGFNTLPCNTSGRSFTASIVDQAGVGVGPISPKLYYRINSGAYTSATGLLQSGSPTFGTWLFSLNYSAGVGDVVSWYLLSQDGAGNVGCLPSSQSFTATSVNSVTAVPIVNTYTVQINLGGTYTVGAGGTFTTLTEAARAYNLACLTGPVTFVLTNTLYSTYSTPTETFPVLFTNNPYASQTNSLLITPASGVNVLIAGYPNNLQRALIKMTGARFITIDGTGSGGSSLTMEVTPYYFSANVWLTNDNKNLQFKKIDLVAAGGYTHHSYGILTAAENFTDYSIPIPYYTGGTANDTILVNNCTFGNLGFGIYAVPANNPNTPAARNWTISNNFVGAAGTASSYVRYGGIFMGGSMCIVANNTVAGVVNTSTTYTDPQNGLYNIIHGITVSGTRNIISKNIVRNMSTNEEAVGMVITGGDRGSDIEVSNNMVIDIRRNSVFHTPYVKCIVLDGDRIKVNHNTFALTQGTYAVGGPLISAPLIFPRAVQIDGGTNMTFNNNIVYNNIYRTAGSVINHGIFMNTNVNPFSQIDYNNYYLPGPDGYMGYFNGNQVASFSSFKNIVGGNQNSTLLPVAFTASNDAHLDPTSLVNSPFQNSGTPIAGITTDIDNQARSLTAPTIGADEFTSLAVCNSATVDNFAPATISVCAGDPVVLNGQGSSTGIGLSLQWEQAPVSAGTFTSVNYGSGSASSNFIPGALPAGVYYYRLTATCSSASLTGSSNVLTVNIVNPPSITVTPTSYSICTGQAVSFTASGATNYTWSNGNTYSITTEYPNQSIQLFISYSNPSCPTQSAGPFFAYFNVTPTLSATSPASFVCNGVNATISASGASTYSWSNGATGATINPSPSVTTVYTVTGQNGNCTSTAAHTITVRTAPSLSISGLTNICSGQSVTLVASGANSYTWNASVVSASLTATPLTSTVYNVTGTNSQSCTATKAHTVQVNSSTGMSISGPSVACQGQPVTLTASGAGTYSWSNGANTNTITVSPATTTNYSVTGGPAGCISSAVANVSVSALPTLSISGSPAVCQGQPVNLTVSGASNYTWNTGATAASFSDAPATNTVYSVIGTTSIGCAGNASLAVSVNTLPAISVSQSTATVCPGSAVTFTASGGNTYTWSAGGNSSVITLTPSAASVHTVTGSNAQGCSSSQTAAIGTNSVATIGISPSTATICAQSTINLTASGAASYTWSHGGGNMATTTYSTNSSTVYSVTGADAGNGCTNTQTISVITNSLPVIMVTGPSTLCAGQSATLLATGAANYLWNTTATTPFIIVSPVAATNYLVIGTGANGCSSSTGFAISTNSLPVITAGASSTLVCSTSQVTLTAGGASTYTWTGVGSGSNLAVSPVASTAYTVSGSSPAGCTSTAAISISTNSLPVIAILPPAATVCAQSPVSFTASGAATYTWSNGAGNLANASFTPFINSTYTVMGTDVANGCISSKTVAVTSNSLPIVNIFGPSSVCVGQSATLIAAGANSYIWNTTATTAILGISPVANTSYFVVGTSSAGCSSSASFAVTSNSLPVIGITPASPSICASSSLVLTGTGATSYTWSTGPNGNTVTVSPSAATVYSVNGSNAAGCISGATVGVTTNSLPLVAISPSSATVCAQSPVNFTASGAASYTWSNGGSNLSAAGFTPTGNSVYTVSGTDAFNGCISSKTVGVSVNALPTLSVTGNASICAGQSTTLTPLGANTYTWNNIPGTGSIVVSPAANTTYSLNGTSTAGCTNSISIAVTSNSLPVITVVQSATTVCALSPVTFTASGASGYTWSPSGNANTITLHPSAPAVYTVSGSSNSGCVSSKTVAINTNSLPAIAISPATATVCSLSPVSFSASGADTYSWSSGGGNATQATYTPSGTSVYSVSGSNTVTGCVASQTLQVTVLALPQLSINGQTLICSGQPATLLVSGAASYSWSGGQLTASISESPSVTTTYSVTGTGSNSCQAPASVQVSVMALPTVVVNSGSICAGGVFTINPGGAFSYTYSSGSNTVSPASNASFSVTGTGTNGCVSQSAAISNVTVNTNPTITVNSGSICAGQVFTINAGGADTYTYSGGSNTVSPSSTTSYSVTGTYTTGCTSQAAAVSSVTVNPAPVLTTTGVQTLICSGESITLTASGADTYTWDASTSGASIAVSPTTTTSYTVSGSDTLGCSADAVVTQSVDACTSVKNEGPADVHWALYPNPNNGEFTIEASFTGDLIIYNVIGEIVYEGAIENTTQQVSLGNKANGVYFVYLRSNNVSRIVKVIKNQ